MQEHNMHMVTQPGAEEAVGMLSLRCYYSYAEITALIRPFYGRRHGLLDLWIAKSVICWAFRLLKILATPKLSFCGWREFERAERSRESSKRKTVWHAADVPGHRVWSGSGRRLPGTHRLSSVQRSRKKPYSQPNRTRVTNWNR